MRPNPESTPDDPQQAAPKRPPAPHGAPKRKQDGGKKFANGIVTLSSAAIIAVYAAGYLHTASAEASITSATPAPLVANVASTATATATAATLLTPTATAAAPTATTSTIAAAPTATATTAFATATTAPALAAVATATSTTAATATTAQVAAATATTAAPTTAAAASATYKDGTYTGSGTSRHGGVTVAVVIKNGVIVSSEITASNTRYPISRIAALPGEVVAAQSASIDFVSGATDSSTAFQTAVASALALAKGA